MVSTIAGEQMRVGKMKLQLKSTLQKVAHHDISVPLCLISGRASLKSSSCVHASFQPLIA
eukprot:5644452-Amphidinium_carterae.1